MLNTVQLDLISYTKNSISVDINRSQGWVEITDLKDADNCFFLQGEDGYSFVDRLDELSDLYPDVNFDDLEYLAAYDYCGMFS